LTPFHTLSLNSLQKKARLNAKEDKKIRGAEEREINASITETNAVAFRFLALT
jgi:hypothetical protein